MAVREQLGGDILVRGGHCIGTPDRIVEHLRGLRAAGLDQVILLHQAGRATHEEICASLELFAAEVIGEFAADREERNQRKKEQLGPYVVAALQRRARIILADEDIRCVGPTAGTVPPPISPNCQGMYVNNWKTSNE